MKVIKIEICFQTDASMTKIDEDFYGAIKITIDSQMCIIL